jgi:outer membrane lipoprotein-sorting protein
MRWPISSSARKPAPRRSALRRLRHFRCLLLLVVAARAAAATCDSTESCLRAVDAAQQHTESVSARFTQTKHLALLDEPLVSTGRFVFQRPDRMRLEIETPRSAVIVINGRQVSIPGLSAANQQQLALTPMTAMFTELGAMFGGSAATLRRHFDVSAKPAGDAIEVMLRPTVPDWQRLFRTIGLRFAGPDLLISSMQLEDALGDHLEIAMSDVQRNQDIPDALFTVPTPSAH